MRKNLRFGLRPEIAFFDPPIRLFKNWPYLWSGLARFVFLYHGAGGGN